MLHIRPHCRLPAWRLQKKRKEKPVRAVKAPSTGTLGKVTTAWAKTPAKSPPHQQQKRLHSYGQHSLRQLLCHAQDAEGGACCVGGCCTPRHRVAHPAAVKMIEHLAKSNQIKWHA